jgi:hypothetical protein
MIPFAYVLIQGNRKTAGGLHLMDIRDDDLAGSEGRDEQGGQRRPFGVIGKNRTTLAIKAKDVRRAVKGAKHKGDPAIFEEMGGGLVAAACDVEVCDKGWREHSETIQALWGEVDMAIAAKWGGRDKEHLLMFDESLMRWLNGVGEFAHIVNLRNS